VATVFVDIRPGWVAISPDGTLALVTNYGSTTVSVIDTTTVPPTVLTTVFGVSNPVGIAVTPDGTRAYVANTGNTSVSVIDTNSSSPTFGTVVASVAVGNNPCQDAGIRSCPGIAISRDGARGYVTMSGSNTVTVIDTDPASPTFNTIVDSVTVGNAPRGIAFTPDGLQLYVTDSGVGSNNVSVIDTNPTSPTFDTVVGMVPVGNDPWGVTFTPDGTRAYVANFGASDVSVIDTTTTPPMVVATVSVGSAPVGVAMKP
jgi:YVTN family beta-propeller protein